MLGQTVSHYKILEKLGAGGMGVVYKAQDLKLDRFVVLKFLSSDLTRDEKAKERFIVEAKAASALDHPNVCTIYEIDETDEGHLFIAMAYYEGETLKEKVSSNQLSVISVVEIATQIAQGLARAHEAGIVHRDIKPANIIITKRNEVKILDFGLAKLAGQQHLTKSGATLGTIAYMSPQQAQGLEVDHRTDIWSLGVVMYEMLTGQLPFQGHYDQAVMYSIVNVAPAAVRSLRSEVSARLEEIVGKALAKKLEERYQHIDELLEDLKNHDLATPQKFSQPKISNRDDQRKWRKPAAISAGIGLLLILGFILLRPILFEDELVSTPKPIAVISFENLTGDSTYNYLQKAIPALLITSLEQSKYLQVTTWERMHDLLKQIGKENVETIDKNLGFELCRMDGVNIVVLGSFTKAGETFATDVKVLEVSTKNLVKSASAKGEGIASILKSQIDELSREISRSVGLSKRKVETTQVPIVEVTTASMQAYNYYLRGTEYYGKRYDNDARRLLERAVEIDSAFAMAHLYLAWTYERLGEFRKFRSAYDKAYAHSKRASEKERRRIEIWYVGDIERNVTKADSMLERFVLRYPKDKGGHSTLGMRYNYTGQYQKALEEYNQALTLDPNSAGVFNRLGFIYAKLGNFVKAIECMERYAALSPGEVNPIDSMGEVYLAMGKVDAAIANFKEVQNIKPDFPAIDWRIGYAYALKENYVETMKRLAKSLTMYSSAPHLYYYMRAFYFYFQGQTRPALKDLQRAVLLADSLGRTHWKFESERLQGWIYYEQHEFEAARLAIQKATNFIIKNEVEPNRKFFHQAYLDFYNGLVFIQHKQLDSAQYHLNQIKLSLVEKDPLLNERILFLQDWLYAEILQAQNSLPQAFAVIHNIKLPLLPLGMRIPSVFIYNFPLRNDLAARVYIQQGNIDGAIGEYERLTTIDSINGDTRLIPARFHYRLARLYEQKGLIAKAMVRYEHFLDVWKNADPDWPELSDARTRLAKLNALKKK